jgi:16S rRNA A1518/A1519 N6-dimethyltransferase RsmA/KsgA/DIM1 with predicted DNA glycosylase/AP lyase activity
MNRAEKSTTIEIDSDLLSQLRTRHPSLSDTEIVEDIARIELGFAALRQASARNALEEDEANERAVAAVHAARTAPST